MTISTRRSHREPPPEQQRINRRIRVPEVRVIDEDGAQLGVMQTRDALRIAQEKQLDLVEVAARVRPPVCRIMDYGKFKYEEAKKTRRAKKASTKIEVKEIKFRPKTDGHDYSFKARNVRRFLEEGNKVRLVVQFRGREIVHPETGRAVLERMVKECMDICHVENIPMMEGRRMLMIIAPKAHRQQRPTIRPSRPETDRPEGGPARGPALPEREGAAGEGAEKTGGESAAPAISTAPARPARARKEPAETTGQAPPKSGR